MKAKKSVKEMVENVNKIKVNLGNFTDKEGDDIPDELKVLVYDYLKFRKEIEEQQVLLSAKADQLISHLKESENFKTVWSEAHEQRVTLTEKLDYLIDHDRLDPLLKLKNLYEECLETVLINKNITLDMVREHFPAELFNSVTKKEFNNDLFTQLLTNRKLQYEEIVGIVGSKATYTITRNDQSKVQEEKRIAKLQVEKEKNS